MKKYFIALGLAAIFALPACSGSDDSGSGSVNDPVADEFIRAADISTLPEIEAEGTVFYAGETAEDPVTTLKNAGVNCARIRIWHNPSNGHSGIQEVKALAQRVKNAGMKVWLTVHYSDTWADPGQQLVPSAWSALSFDELKIAAENYTSQILTEIDPDIIQIGNETNDGLLWPAGRLSANETQSVALFQAISQKIRTQSPDAKIMLHYAGISGAEWFFSKMSDIDYDYIGLSYYPVWHGSNVALLTNLIDTLGASHDKKVLIAETAYPFTLGWNDWTNNIVGEQGQLVPGYPATPIGQKGFLRTIRNIVDASPHGHGFAYWGGEWIAFRGTEATNGSTFENQALWDFDHKKLPVMDAFNP
ncbi:glycoside hydrolase family 53 protein [Flavobacterium selenitireducens]|uniref:glycoside hydrolase family 53 protein n=1 Tax=Flavobacterium selenitireducens TaxID=2722704 RepID=UPI00168B9958|nr:glycosyl hydrolase 53 family protein [Flavobacterium selenitireducens]MBD3581826.1 arabinogalactan endo-1,4-beta-galactosidase [Flavobacterium selenitireducens]